MIIEYIDFSDFEPSIRIFLEKKLYKIPLPT